MFLDFLSVFLQKFLEIVLPVLATALAGLVIAWITKIVNEIKAKLSDNAEWAISEAVRCAVLAAEQVNLSGLVDDKKQYALSVAENWLSGKGIKIDLNILDARIEAAVMDEFNRNKVQPAENFPAEPE